ncbi:hypothetical protein EVAR_58755_1 [Eumeta japonica]|uniref:Uncharacterized protein n=1 Tax=Eumeta variegata TaxID=151549 RepID=A0A4C1ZEA5_EUMVA|nr:hypothetical protein EVAR_58755_1 [Eumeta japonica]
MSAPTRRRRTRYAAAECRGAMAKKNVQLHAGANEPAIGDEPRKNLGGRKKPTSGPPRLGGGVRVHIGFFTLHRLTVDIKPFIELGFMQSSGTCESEVFEASLLVEPTTIEEERFSNGDHEVNVAAWDNLLSCGLTTWSGSQATVGYK